MLKPVRLLALACLALAAGAASARDTPKPDSPVAGMDDASKNDLPFPKDATQVQFSPERLQLALLTGGTIAEMLAFYRHELGARGWTEWVPSDPRKIDIDAAGTRALIYFTRESKNPLVLVLQRRPDRDITTVNIQTLPPETLAAIEKNPPHPNTARTITAAAPVASAGAAHPAQSAPPVAETAAEAKPVRVPETPRDMRDLPRPAGAYMKDEDARKNDQHSVRYMMPISIAGAKSALTKLLTDDGWVAFVEPLAREDGRSLYFKKTSQSVSLHFHADGEARSGVWLTSNRSWNDLPTPPGTTDVVFDDRRPFMTANAPGTVEGLLEFFRNELIARGWTEWSAADNARYPNARIDTTIDGGVRAYFTRDARDRQAPIQVSLGHRADNRIDIEVKVPAFARPQQLTAEWKTYGLPRPELIKSASSRESQTTREMKATVPAELGVVLAFYRGELPKRGWKEDEGRAQVKSDEAALHFAAPDEGMIELKLSYRYDLTVVELTQRLNPAVAAARQKAVRDREEQVRRDLEARMRAAAVESEAIARQAKADQAAARAKAEEPLEAEDYNGFPVPESSTSKRASSSKFRAELNAKVRGELATVLAFYRRELAKLNWKEDEGAAIRPDRATVAYASPEGPALLTLGREDGMTTISVALRKPEEARKAGILPKPGTARVIMGSMIDRQAVVTINNRAISIGAGVGKDAPNGPTLDLPPGKYRYTLKVPGRPVSSEDVTVRADQTWALIVGPGGAPALNLY